MANAFFDKNASIGIAWSDDLVTWNWPGKYPMACNIHTGVSPEEKVERQPTISFFKHEVKADWSTGD